MAELTRKSVAAIKKETTIGVPVAPTGATDFIALQDGGFTLEPAFQELENNELKASIGASKNEKGLEEPSASISHYLRHSGVEGQAPNFGELVESAFGAVVVAGTEYDTAASSTAGSAAARAVIKMPTGEGANFQRGQGLLIKDGTNGRSIRAIHSVSTDDLNLLFNLTAAPASGVNLGKAVLYKPADSGHASLSYWLYRANGAATEMVSGGRVTEMSVDIPAGEYINTEYTLQGAAYYFNPIEITATSKYIDFEVDSGVLAAVLTEQIYKDPTALADEIQSKMSALLGVGESVVVKFVSTGSDAGKFTLTFAGTAVAELHWATGANTANSAKTKLGFANTDDTGALTYKSDNVQSYAAPYTPSYDVASPLVAKNNELLIGGFNDFECVCATQATFTISNEVTNVLCACEESGVAEKLITGRTASLEISAILEKHQVDYFSRFRQGLETSAQYVAGVKSGTDWEAGKCALIAMPTCTISSITVDDQDGYAVLNMTLSAYVNDSGEGEVYMNFL